MKSFMIDIAKCNGCYNCQVACKEEHVGNDWTPYAKPQPDTGQFWMKMHEKVRGAVPKVKVSYVPTPCMHCADAKCIASCAPGVIYRRDDGLVVIDPVKCTGCMGCLDVCPIIPSKKNIEWDIDDPKGKPLYFFRQVREKIRDKVKGLIRSMITDELSGNRRRTSGIPLRANPSLSYRPGKP